MFARLGGFDGNCEKTYNHTHACDYTGELRSRWTEDSLGSCCAKRVRLPLAALTSFSKDPGANEHFFIANSKVPSTKSLQFYCFMNILYVGFSVSSFHG